MSVCIYLYLHFWLAFFLSLYKIARLSVSTSVSLSLWFLHLSVWLSIKSCLLVYLS